MGWCVLLLVFAALCTVPVICAVILSSRISQDEDRHYAARHPHDAPRLESDVERERLKKSRHLPVKPAGESTLNP